MMSLTKAVPEGLKDQECKKGSCAKHPPIPYVPVVNPVQDLVNAKEPPMKIKLPDRTKKIQVPIWDSGTPEAFLFIFISACKCKGYFKKYHDAINITATSKTVIKCSEAC